MVLRQRVWIDRRVQGVLIGRIVLYWLCGLTYLGLGSACFQYYQQPEWTFAEHAVALATQFGPWLPSLILVMPLVVYDIVRLSNLFVGPIYHLKRHLITLARDPECHPLSFRDDDYWHDLVAPVNALQTEILQLRKEVTKLKRAQFTTEKRPQASEQPCKQPSEDTSEDTSEKPSVTPGQPSLQLGTINEMADAPS